jgi:hypothetical protein
VDADLTSLRGRGSTYAACVQQVSGELQPHTASSRADAPAAEVSRAVGGLGVVLGIALLLLIPLLLAAARSASTRSASRRSGAAHRAARGAPPVDAWALSARRFEEKP